MTRDEAIEIAFKNQAECVKMSISPKDRLMCASADIETSIALGMLKLDEPLSKDQRIARVLTSFRQSHNGLNGFLNELEAAGLRIVEK